MADESAAPFALVASSMLDDITPHGYFAPVERNQVDALLRRFEATAAQIEAVSRQAEGFFNDVLPFFLDGNLQGDSRRPTTRVVSELFGREGALASARATYWQRALDLTDIYQHMPAKRRTEWNEALQKHQTPAFDAETVYSTLRELLLSRERFLAERVDGVFRSLSGTHLTNSPAGFRNRMIVDYVCDKLGMTNHDRVGYINDLRVLLAGFMKRGEPHWRSSYGIVDDARKHHRGEWIVLDGGALRLRAYDCGTVHVEIHPDFAWRLNAILATLHPDAIPSEHRTRPKRAVKAFALLEQPLPFAVLEVLGEMKPARDFSVHDRGSGRFVPEIPNTLAFSYATGSAELRSAAGDVLQAIGGVLHSAGHFEFGYPVQKVMGEILASGVIPQAESHQFYPTPPELAARVVDACGIEPSHRVLEPSAGQGGIAALLPSDRTTCVEVSALHCRILRAKGYRTCERDFLEWAREQVAAGHFFDRVVMNPPFSQGRAALHLDAARSVLAPGGRIVAVLPASFRNRPVPSGWVYRFSEALTGLFAGTSAVVTILIAERQC